MTQREINEFKKAGYTFENKGDEDYRMVQVLYDDMYLTRFVDTTVETLNTDRAWEYIKAAEKEQLRTW